MPKAAPPNLTSKLWDILFKSCAVVVIICLFINLQKIQRKVDFMISHLIVYKDSDSCDDQLSKGVWMGHPQKSYVTTDCFIHSYSDTKMKKCLSNRTIVFQGDSMVRNLFLAARIRLGYSKTKDYGIKFRDNRYDIMDQDGLSLKFVWDPYLNQTINNQSTNTSIFYIFSTGLWHMRYLNETIAYKEFKNSIDSIPSKVASHPYLVRLISPLVDSQLDSDRKKTLEQGKINVFNRYLRDQKLRNLTLISEALNSVYEVANDQSIDGLHYRYPVVSNEWNIFMNLLCNEKLLENKKGTTTCCVKGPLLATKQIAFIGCIFLFGFISYLLRILKAKCAFLRIPQFIPTKSIAQSLMTLALVLGYMAIADRSPTFLKLNKVYDGIIFTLGLLCVLIIGLLTLQQSKDQKFLNRFQTDEWKGWMQFFILIYHYMGASKIAIVYNFIRVLVASYVFMTGYGHFTFFYKKKDFGYKRIYKVLLRLNLLTLAMSYTMDQPIIFYYFAPMVSFWFMIIYLTLWIGSSYNERNAFLFIKILIAMCLSWSFIHLPLVLETFFDGIQFLFSTDKWDVVETRFRLRLDEWMVYIGMLVAWLCIKFEKYSQSILTTSRDVEEILFSIPHRYPRLYKRIKVLLFVLCIVFIFGFFIIDASMPSKFVYNQYHSLLSIPPVIAFIYIRNYNETIRRYHSKFFVWIGQISLETFLLQYHIWLALDTKGLLILFPMDMVALSLPFWIHFIVSTVVFLGVSQIVSKITGELVDWISIPGFFVLWGLFILLIWKSIAFHFCSFKVKTPTQNFCRNEYNVTGLCSKQSCPLANSRYATIKEIQGTLYLYVKTIERAHSPAHLWEKIQLSKNYSKAIEQINEELKFWPEFLVHKCKQRLTKMTQYLIRMRKLKLKGGPQLVGIKKKIEKREAKKEAKAHAAARLEMAIEKELLERLRKGVYGNEGIVNESQSAFKKALDELEQEEELTREFVSDISDEEDMEDSMSAFNEREFDDFTSSDDDDASDASISDASDEDSHHEHFNDKDNLHASSKKHQQGYKKKRAHIEIEYEQEGPMQVSQ